MLSDFLLTKPQLKTLPDMPDRLDLVFLCHPDMTISKYAISYNRKTIYQIPDLPFRVQGQAKFWWQVQCHPVQQNMQECLVLVKHHEVIHKTVVVLDSFTNITLELFRKVLNAFWKFFQIAFIPGTDKLFRYILTSKEVHQDIILGNTEAPSHIVIKIAQSHIRYDCWNLKSDRNPGIFPVIVCSHRSTDAAFNHRIEVAKQPRILNLSPDMGLRDSHRNRSIHFRYVPVQEVLNLISGIEYVITDCVNHKMLATPGNTCIGVPVKGPGKYRLRLQEHSPVEDVIRIRKHREEADLASFVDALVGIFWCLIGFCGIKMKEGFKTVRIIPEILHLLPSFLPSGSVVFRSCEILLCLYLFR